MNLPDFFDRLFWSQDFSQLNPEEDREIIVIQAINYGDLEHWRWLKNFYGKEEVARVISQVPATTLRSRVKPLVSLIFGVKKFNHARRSP